MSSPATIHDLAPNLEKCFLFDATEAAYEMTGITGRVPEWLRGTYYVNGPARFERAGRRYKHWLDGDGMVCRLHFGSGGIDFTNRFVRTPKLLDEEAAGEFLYRGFGTAWKGDRLRRKVMLEGPCNVSAYPYNGVLLAFAEQSIPFNLDPVTLETRGVYDFNGSVNEVTPFVAHAKSDGGHLLNFGISFSATAPMLNTYEFDGGGNLLKRRRYPLQYQHSNHDFAITPNRMVFFLSPLIMNFSRFWGDGVSVMESLDWEPEKGSRILVTPRAHRHDEAFWVEAGGGYCLHVINAFEDGNRLALDLLLLDEPVYREYEPIPDLFPTVTPCRAVRYWIDLETRQLLGTERMTYDRSPDFPNVDQKLAGRRYNDFWMLGISESGGQGRKFFDELAHGSWRDGDVRDIYRVPRGEYLGGEPCFVANPANREEGVVICQHMRPAEGLTEFLLFDAFDVKRGPIAVLPTNHMIHAGFHTSFTTSGGRL